MEPYVVGYASFIKTKLVDSNNQFFESIHIKEARDRAKEVGLDLVCFNMPTKETLALCKIIDFGKWKYQQEKAKKKADANNKVEIKEVRFTPVIGDNDIEHKVKQINGFLKDGDEVVITMRFKGIHHRLLSDGESIINIILDKCKASGKVVSRKNTGDNIWIKMVKI